MARKGEAVQKPPRAVTVYELEYLQKTGENRYLFRVLCSKGTYIRVICQDIGKRLGIPAHMSFLLRTQSGGQHINHAYTCDELQTMSENNDFSYIADPEVVLQHLPKVQRPAYFESKIMNGIAIRGVSMPDGDFLVYCGSKFLGIGENAGGVKIRIPLYEL